MKKINIIVGYQLIDFHFKNPQYINKTIFSSCQNIYPEHVKAFPDFGWNYTMLSLNENFTLEDILEFPTVKNMTCISLNKNITFKKVFEYPELDWNWECLSSNPSITMELVLLYLSRWDWKRLSANPGITIQDIKSNPSLPWDWKETCNNPNIRLKDIDEYNKNIYALVKNPGMSMEDLTILFGEKLKNKYISLYISENPNITLEFIELNPDIHFNYRCIEHLDLEKLKLNTLQHHTQMKYYRQSQLSIEETTIFWFSSMNKYKFQGQRNLVSKELKAVEIIKRNYIKAFWNPDTYLGRKRLERSLREDYSVW